jgi:hypothetical protein
VGWMMVVNGRWGVGAYDSAREVELELGGHWGWEMEMYVS